MKRSNRVLVASALALLAPASVRAQDALSVDQIIALHIAGLGDEAIIAKIRSAGSAYILGADEMIALRGRGISGPVIAAMLGGSGEKTIALSTDSADPAVPHAPGAYVLKGGTQPAMARIDATTASQARTGNILGYALTAGIASMSVKSVIQNENARVMISETRPVFYFFFDESNPTLPASTAWGAGTAAPLTSPAEFSLIKLHRKNGQREARIGRVNITGAKFGVMDKDRIDFDYQLVRTRVFKAVPRAALAPGEYGFIYSVGGGAAGAAASRVFDFTIRPDA